MLEIASKCLLAVVLSIALAMPSFPQASDHQSEIPFEHSSVFGLILVRIVVNGRPAVFIVDTASSRTILSAGLIDMHLPSATSVSTSKGSGFQGAGILAKATLKVGPITWHEHTVVVMEMRELSSSLGQHIDGLLGIDFFSEFKVVVIDLKNRKLILKP
jgi:predicted aspartyl protease